MLALLTLATTALSACTPTPEPTPTPTAAFASEEEAFAAAEEVYRAYNDAGNAEEDTSPFLTGAALDSQLETRRYLDQNGLTLSGDSTIVSFVGSNATPGQSVSTIEAQVCLDIGQSRVLDDEGNDVTPADRAPRWPLIVTFVGSSQELLISDSIPSDDPSC